MSTWNTFYRKMCNTVGRLGADIRYTQSKKKMNLLMLACKKSNVSIVERLLKSLSEEKYQRDIDNKNIIHYTIENDNQSIAISILQLLLEEQTLFKQIFKYQSKEIILHIISHHKTEIFKFLIEEEIVEIDHQNILVLHEIVKEHKKHKNKSITFMFLKIILFRGYPENIVNKEGQNYKDYAFNKRYMSKYEMQEILEEIYKEMNQKTTSETSRASKIIDNQSFLEFQIQEYHDNSLSEGSQEQILQNENQRKEKEQLEQEQDYKAWYEEKHKVLSQQIVDFGLKMYQDYKNVSIMISPFIEKIQEIVHGLYGTLQIIGSFANNLWIQKSDIDLLVIFPSDQNLDLFDEVTEIFFNQVNKLNQYAFIRLYRNFYKLPMIKIILNEKYNKHELQIFISSKTSKASKYVIYINNILSQYPEIQYIYYFLRKILSLKQLHDHKKGGLKAYALLLLIVSIRQNYKYSYLSQYIECFCYYYGIFYDYPVQINQNGETQFKLNINDPLNYLNNMGGKKTNILAFQQLLKKVYYAININCFGSKLSFIFDTIIEI